MKKRFLATILCICLVVSVLGVPIAQARWTNTASITLDMSISNGTITSKGTIRGNSGTSNIAATYTLEKLVSGKYTYVDSWSDSSSSFYFSNTHTTSNCTSGTYKLTVTGTVTKDGYAEPIEDWLSKPL